MQYTPEQIEEKRRIAQAKLRERANRLSINNVAEPLQNTSSSSMNCTTSLKNQFRFKVSPLKSNAKPYDKPLQVFQQSSLNQVQFQGKDEKVVVKFALVSEDRFKCETSIFSGPVIEIFKAIPSRNYNPKTRQWDFNIKDYNILVSKLQLLLRNVTLERIPQFVLNCLKGEKRDISNIELNNLDPELSSALMPFQLDGVRYVIDKNGRAMIADDMGLGKTFQALAIANYYRDDWPLLIVTTSSTKNVWEETIHKYLPSVSIFHVKHMNSAKDYIADAKILIVSHDMMSRSIDVLVERNFGVIIIDESHYLKNFKAKCTKSANDLAKKAKRVILLSGTPALSRPSELYTQINLIDPKFVTNFIEYSRRYCDGKQTNFGWDSSGKSNLQELEIILNRRFMIRRTKDEVLKMLPTRKQEIIILDVNLEQFSAEDRKCLHALGDKYKDVKGNKKHAALLTFFAETAKIKIPSVCSYVLQVLQSEQKFLVFAHHQKMLDAICEVLRKKSVKFIRIDGACTSDQRKWLVDKFQLDDSYRVAVLSIMAAHAGITLTAAQLVVFAELHWNPSVLSQAESRAHRIGQMHPVLVKYLLAPGTADDFIWPMLQNKQKILAEINLSKNNFNDIAVTKQNTGNEVLADDLNITPAGTLDISCYFQRPNKSSVGAGAIDDWLDDGMDELLLQIDL